MKVAALWSAAAACPASLVLLATCAAPLEVHSVEPAVVAPGGTLTVVGAGFDGGLELELAGAGLEVRLQQTRIEHPGRALGTVPLATPAGSYELRARQAGQTATLEDIQVVTGGVRVHFLDVGQGDATLVVAPGGETLLIDGGPRDAIEVLEEAIASLAGGRLDAVVLSHTDADHLGGLVELLAGPDRVAGTSDDRVPAQRLSPPDEGSCSSQLCGRARELVAWPFSAATPGEVIALGDADVGIVASNGDVGDGPLPGANDENERSAVVRVSYAGRTALVTGDLTGGGNGNADVEGPLALKTGPVDVLRVAHHGSNTSSNADALATWAPRALVLSLGDDNAYCHPASEALVRLDATGAAFFATGRGMDEDAERCGGATAWPERARVGLGHVTLEMNSDGALVLGGELL